MRIADAVELFKEYAYPEPIYADTVKSRIRKAHIVGAGALIGMGVSILYGNENLLIGWAGMTVSSVMGAGAFVVAEMNKDMLNEISQPETE